VPRFRGDLSVLGDVDISPTPSPDDTPPAPPAEALTLGRLIRYSQSPTWVGNFVDENGFSPIKLLYELWSEQLYLGAVPPAEASGAGINDQERSAFRDGVLQFVRPIDGWVASDEKGKIRWGYEVIDGREADLLEFLYPRLPNSPSEMASRIGKTGLDRGTALDLAGRRFAESSERSPVSRPVRLSGAMLTRRSVPRMEIPELDTSKIATQGPFNGTPIATFRTAVSSFVADITTKLADVRTVQNPVQTWVATLPTQGVYSDLSLGVCSGAEDYLEIQRQFDLETRKLEIEKLKCEIEKLKLENQRLQGGEPSLVIQSDADQTSVNLNFTAPGETPAGVKIQTPGP
jgi:hypothetical protein